MNLDDLTRTSGEWLRGTGPESDIVMCSRIRLARNLNDFPFINRASRLERTEIESVSGTQFDPEVVDAFRTMPAERFDALRQEVG